MSCSLGSCSPPQPTLCIAGLLTSACMLGVKFAALEGFEEKMGAEARLEAERAALVPCP